MIALTNAARSSCWSTCVCVSLVCVCACVCVRKSGCGGMREGGNGSMRSREGERESRSCGNYDRNDPMRAITFSLSTFSLTHSLTSTPSTPSLRSSSLSLSLARLLSLCGRTWDERDNFMRRIILYPHSHSNLHNRREIFRKNVA
jgi:hypothetical protein